MLKLKRFEIIDIAVNTHQDFRIVAKCVYYKHMFKNRQIEVPKLAVRLMNNVFFTQAFNINIEQ